MLSPIATIQTDPRLIWAILKRRITTTTMGARSVIGEAAAHRGSPLQEKL